jgi:hypothetical protein
VFSATKAKERELLGELITDWIRSNQNCVIVDKIVTQSSDSEFHCLTITLFYKHKSDHPHGLIGWRRPGCQWRLFHSGRARSPRG